MTYPLNCDNLYQAFKLLFVTSTLDGWPKYMYWFIDSDSRHPAKNKNMYLSLYFVSFIVLSGFFMMNLFVSIVALYFTKVKEQMIITKQLKQNAKNWAYFQNIIKYYKPDFNAFFAPENKPGAFLFKLIINNKVFDVFILIAIIGQAILTASYMDDSSVAYT